MSPKLKTGARGGFSTHKKKARNNMEIPDILTPNTEALFSAVVYHALLCGACFIATTNRARSGVKIKLMLDDDHVEEWMNTPEEAQEHLFDMNEMLVETARARGYLPAPQNV